VLIVDDSPYNLFVLRELISRLDPLAQVDEALNGEESLKLIDDLDSQRDGRDHYDLILMDLHMPILDGFKAARRLREKQKAGILDLSHTELVALSAMSQNQQQFRDHEAKADDSSPLFDAYLEKPVRDADLKAALS
jgi:CheY-like chemotaxis protein